VLPQGPSRSQGQSESNFAHSNRLRFAIEAAILDPVSESQIEPGDSYSYAKALSLRAAMGWVLAQARHWNDLGESDSISGIAENSFAPNSSETGSGP